MEIDHSRAVAEPVMLRVGFAVTLAALATVATLGANSMRPLPAMIGAGVLAAACVGVALTATRWPRTALVAVPALLGVYFATGGADGPIYLLPALAAFGASSARPVRELAVPGLVAGLVLAVGMTARVVVTGYPAWVAMWQTLGTAAIAVAAAAVGLWRSARRDANAERVRRAATEEQLRIARDLHDGVGHGLAVIAMQAGVALHVLDRDPDAVRAALVAIRDTSRDALGELRAELTTLTGDTAERRPQRGLADLPVLVDRIRAAGLVVDVQVPAHPLPTDVDHVAYAIVAEAMTNVLRHAQADTVIVEIADEGRAVTVRVADDGRGRTTSASTGGLGLRAMEDRAAALGGTLIAEPGPERGFVVRAVLPVGASERVEDSL
ncbi:MULTISPECIES: sensor histidine kinase [Rhodococcus]|uniref:histidine kinase n=1 Tax=Rhodococcus rhodochrous TaxID=1829 RepID=A0AA47A8T6_RHORH|nr:MULTISPECIES: sensor histidine kinase [Rhodococcus]MDC3726619.1 sensor histidine kinase [Rhodococcus sp. Rp3]UZF42877.1 sensor histidine kinase [Rhodococcus rhodochrous]WSE20510.1 sensor histidine kinase [Rhodococcus sp. PD04]